MAGGYRCSLGHTWNPPDRVAVTTCPVCGDLTLTVIEVEPPIFVITTGHTGGQDATQPLGVPQVAVASPEHAPAAAFASPTTPPPNGSETPDPSFSSLVVLLPEPGVLSLSGTSASSVVPFGAAETSDFTPPLVPGYEIIHEVGRGGMGVVYKARQLSLNRLVALKMILSGVHAGPTERERFKREAEAVAALQHAHIVQIFDIGEANGHPYLALEFVDGGSLAQNLTGEPWESRRAAEVIEVLARTMQFAHDAGIVHRDLKPGNVLLATGGRRPAAPEEVELGGVSSTQGHAPKITDFGLAKRLDETLGGDGGTRTGAVMGTPSYIAPEQASGKTRDVGPAVDVYALGAILYELLTGRPPFRGETPLDTVLQVLHDDPVPPKRLHPLVPRDLETICLKCLSKHSAKRYADAAALAEDLGRFQRGEPIKARPLSAWGRGIKWSRRHPALAVLLGMTITATVALVTVLSVAYARVRDAVYDKEHEAWVAAQERDRAEVEKRRAEALAADNDRRRAEAVQKAEELKREAERTRRAAYALQLAQVAILCDRDPLRAAMLLEDETRCPKDLRDFAWHYLRRLCQRDDRGYLDHGPDDALRTVAYSPAGTFVATAGNGGQVRVWDPRTGRTWAILAGHFGAIHGLAFSPDGTMIATTGADGTVRLWVLPVEILDTARRAMTALPWLVPTVAPFLKAPTLTPTITLAEAHSGEALCVAFSPDSRTLVSGGGDGVIRWWDLTGWRPAGVDLAALGGPGAAAAMLTRAGQSPDASPVWMLREVAAHTGGVLCLAFSQNGKILASGGNDQMARVWVGDGTKLIRLLLPKHADAVRAVAVSPDGQTVATVNNAQSPTIRLFNTQTWRERRLFGHTASIYALTISDDGLLLASAGFDKTVRLWEMDDGRERGKLVGHTQQVSAVAFSPDRKTIVSAGMDGVAVVWQTSIRTHEPEDLLRFSRDFGGKMTAQGLAAVGVGGGGNTFLAADDTGWVRMTAADYVPTGRDLPPNAPTPLTLIRIPFAFLPPRADYHVAAVTPDGRMFVATTDTSLSVWRILLSTRPRPGGGPPATLPLGRPVQVPTPRRVHAMAISPSGRWLATADPEGVRLYDLHDPGMVPLTSAHFGKLKEPELVLATPGARELAFHPKQDWLAVAVGTGVRIVTFQGKVLADVPKAHGTKATVETVAFNQAGTQLATADASGLIKLWAVAPDGSLTFARNLPGHTSAVYAMAFSPDGRTLVSGGNDRTVVVWDPIAGQERLTLTGHADRVLKVAFNASGTALVTISRDGAVKRWRADVRPTPDPGMRFPLALNGR